MMEQKDNVYEKMTQTGDIAVAKVDAGLDTSAGNSALAVLGKFKDVNALAKAYGALEAEFTKRSQRLKELERASENWQVRDDASAGAEKLRKHAKERREETKAFDEFLASVGKAHTDGAGDSQPEVTIADAGVQAETPDLQEREKQGGMYAMNEKSAQEDALADKGNAAELERGVAAVGGSVSNQEETEKSTRTDVAKEGAFLAVANHGIAKTSSDELYQQVCGDEQVRLRVIGEYLSSIGKTNAPLTAVGAGVPITPPLRARTIGDASAMALRYLKQPLQK